jgi:hypothetical protein
MNKTHDNKLIAEFMGLGSHNNGYHWLDLNKVGIKTYSTQERFSLRFNSSWDWLMPVVEKCSNYCKSVFNKNCVDIHVNILNSVGSLNIESTYHAVVEFIKWYNQNK